SHTATKHKGKEITKPVIPLSESASEEDDDPKQAQKDKEMQKNLALITKYFKKLYKPTNNNLRTSSNTKNKNVNTTPSYKNDNQNRHFRNQRTMSVAGARETVGSQVVQQTGIQCFNYKEFGHFAKECRNPKRVKDSMYHKENMLLCKQAEKGVPLQAEQSDWLADIDEEIDEQELEAHYSFMAKIQEVPTANSRTDTEPLEQTGYNAVECDDELVALANLISILNLDMMCGGYEIRCGGLGSIFDVLDGVCGVAAFMEKKEEMWPFLGPRNVLSCFGFPRLTNVTTGLSVLLSIGIGSLRGTIAVVAILVKGHTFPTNVKVHPVDEMALLSTTLFFLFKLGCDPLALESKFTLVKESTGVLETMVVEDVVLVGVFPDEEICLVNLIFLSFFFGVKAISLVPKSVMQGQVCWRTIRNS
nr:hypothetical protein [Tanacetum cinerariifolium]